MTAPLTRGSAAAYRSPVGAESVPMGLGKASPHKAPEPRRVSSLRGFSWSGGRITSSEVAGSLVAGSWPSSFRPATRASAKCSGGRIDRSHRSLAMLKSRSCRRVLAERRAP